MEKVKTVTEIQVKVTYVVGLDHIHIPEEAIKQINELQKDSIELNIRNNDYPDAISWLSKNIKESDCFDLDYNIEEFKQSK